MPNARKSGKIGLEVCIQITLSPKTKTMKINPQSLCSKSLFSRELAEVIPQDNPKRVILDKLDWEELCEIGKRAYRSSYWKNKPNPRVMIGLFVWSCLHNKTYREVAEDFSFNILCAYAAGFKTDDVRREIDHSTLVKFEEHLGEENILEIKDLIEKASVRNQPPGTRSKSTTDSTVIESDITFPTDTKIMESVRNFLIETIVTYQREVNQNHRHYSRVARKEYLRFARKRNASKKEIKAIKKKQLQFLRRNLSQVAEVLSALEKQGVKGKLDQKQFKKIKRKFLLAQIIFKQQEALYRGEKIKERIVSFHRPSVRPIFRGKGKKKTEFGPKVELFLIGKALALGKDSFDNFYDGKGLKESVPELIGKGIRVKEIISDKGFAGCTRLLKILGIVDGIERRGKQTKAPPIPKKRFVRRRSEMEGAIGVLKKVFIGEKLRGKTDLGDRKKILKSLIGYNLNYAF